MRVTLAIDSINMPRSASSDSDHGRRDRRHEGSGDQRKANHRSRRDDAAREDRNRRRDRKRDYSDDDDDQDRPHRSHRHRQDDTSSRDDSRRKHHERPHSRDRSRHRRHRRSRSPLPKKRRHTPSVSKSPPRKTRAPLPSQADLFPGSTTSNPNSQPDSANSGPPKQKPNYAPTGLLAKEANTITGTTTVLKYHEPPEARKPPPTQQWRLYVFKQKDLLETLHLYTRSIWLVGRDESITDLYLPHPSISKQHAVIQFRFVSVRDEFGEGKGRVRPYVMDLESANGTSLNGERVEATRFVELRDGDVLGFGESEREFVVMLPPEGSA